MDSQRSQSNLRIHVSTHSLSIVDGSLYSWVDKAVDENGSSYGEFKKTNLWEEKEPLLCDGTTRDSVKSSMPIVPRSMHSLGSEDVFRNYRSRVQER